MDKFQSIIESTIICKIVKTSSLAINNVIKLNIREFRVHVLLFPSDEDSNQYFIGNL